MRISNLRAAIPLMGILMLAIGFLVSPGCAGANSAAGAETPEGDQAKAVEGGQDADGQDADDDDADADDDAAESEPAEPTKKKRKERSTSVTAAAVTRGQLVLPVIAEGSIRATRSTDLRFELGGHVTRVVVQEGQRVRKGQRLAVLDDREIVLALEEANSRYLQALGQLAVEEEGYSSERAERMLDEQTESLQKLEQKGQISRRERLDRELELGMAAVRDGAYRRELMEVRSGLATARADAARLKLDLERTVIRAPFAGVITGLELSAGERVQVGETLCRLVDDVNVEAQVGVLESDLAGLEVGRPALLTLPALGRTVGVQVDVISPDIDGDSRTCNVLLRLKSEGGLIKPGMFVRAAIASRIFPDRLLVPREAILTRDGRPVVFKVDEDRARWVYVQLGERNDRLVEITRIDQGGPLEPGTLVVVDNHLTLTHEAKIKVKKKIQVQDPWATVAAEQG